VAPSIAPCYLEAFARLVTLQCIRQLRAEMAIDVAKEQVPLPQLSLHFADVLAVPEQRGPETKQNAKKSNYHDQCEGYRIPIPSGTSIFARGLSRGCRPEATERIWPAAVEHAFTRFAAHLPARFYVSRQQTDGSGEIRDVARLCH
jgi:hypothetical protein